MGRNSTLAKWGLLSRTGRERRRLESEAIAQTGWTGEVARDRRRVEVRKREELRCVYVTGTRWCLASGAQGSDPGTNYLHVRAPHKREITGRGDVRQ